MRTEFFFPPMPANYIKANPDPGENPLRPALVLAFDDHSENFMVADRETGQVVWAGTSEVQIDCDELIRQHVSEDEDKDETGEPCPICKRPLPDDDDD